MYWVHKYKDSGQLKVGQGDVVPVEHKYDTHQ